MPHPDEELQKSFEFVVTESDILRYERRPRLDAFLAEKLPNTSRARLADSIKQGLVHVNGSKGAKPSQQLREGDTIRGDIVPPPPLEALPEALPLDIEYEDDHVIVINKPADMVMHPSPGRFSGTLVNALLHHCGLPAVRIEDVNDHDTNAQNSRNASRRSLSSLQSGETWEDDEDDDGYGPLAARMPFVVGASRENSSARYTETNNRLEKSVDETVIRPGIVHRLDKGTTGLVVVAKSEAAHSCLSRQFKDRTISRLYLSITLGVPNPSKGAVMTNIGRDYRDRKRMAAFAYGSTRGRMASSRYSVCEELAGGRAALVEWKLETGRTHQIRVHAKHIGHSLIGDEVYGGSGAGTISALASGGGHRSAKSISTAKSLLSDLHRPALHAKTLGFYHPEGHWMKFEAELPDDFASLLQSLRAINA